MEQTNLERLMNLFHQFKHIMSQLPKFSGITHNEFFVMNMIKYFEKKEKDGMGALVSDIGLKMHMSKSALSQVLNSIEEKEYSKRYINPSDRRSVVVRLTEKGNQKLEESKREFFGRMHKVMDKAGPTQMNQFLDSFSAFITAMEEVIKEEK